MAPSPSDFGSLSLFGFRHRASRLSPHCAARPGLSAQIGGTARLDSLFIVCLYLVFCFLLPFLYRAASAPAAGTIRILKAEAHLEQRFNSDSAVEMESWTASDGNPEGATAYMRRIGALHRA